MQNSKVSLRILLYLIAAAALSALFFASGTVAYAQAPADNVISGSDALAAALADSTRTTIVLKEKGIYDLEQSVAISSNVAIQGNGATINCAEGAAVSVSGGASLTVSGVTFVSHHNHSLEVSGSVAFGENVIFAGKKGVLLKKGGQLTSGGHPVTAVTGLEVLVTADPSDGTVSLKDTRLTQTLGQTSLLVINNSSGTVALSGSVDILAADGLAMYCPSEAAGPQISVDSGTSLSIAASNAVVSQGLELPGAAADIRTCDIVFGSNVTLGITGSYCGIAARNITLGENTKVTAVCVRLSDTGFAGCAALSASEKIACRAGVTVTAGASGGNCASGLYAGKGIDAAERFSIMFRGESPYCSAMVSGGPVSVGVESSINLQGGTYGIKSAGLTVGDRSTVNISDIRTDGICSSGRVTVGENATVDIKAVRCAVYSSGGVSFAKGGLYTLSSQGEGAVIWINGSASDDLVLTGCRLSIDHSSERKSEKNAAVFVSGAVSVESGADVTILNNKDFALIAAGGSVNVKGQDTALRCSGGVGVLVSKGSLLVSDNAVFLAEGLLDSAVRVERGSFSATGGARVDVQGARFGVETLSGDVYIDGASSFDIRSTADRAVFVENGRLTILNVGRVSAWKRAKDSKNASAWWSSEPECEYAWEAASGDSRDHWLYADHTALNPNITTEFRTGAAQPGDFAWYDGEWHPSDYSRIGQYCSRPSGRANSFNLPAGKSFSWMLFGASYDDQLEFRLVKSTGDGTFDLREDGTFTYASLDYSRGEQSFDFIVENSDGVSSQPVTVTIFVTASKPPVASSATFPVTVNEQYLGQVNVVDYDGTIAAIRVGEQTRHGKLIINSDGHFSYEPEKGFIGLDGFTYTAVDNLGDESSTGYITFAVGMAEIPVVCNATIITESSVAASTRLTAIRGEDTIQPPPEFVILTQPVYGTIERSESEPDLITYIPYEDFSGTDRFTYAALLEDGSYTETGYVTIATVPSQRPSASGGIFYCTKNSSCSGRLVGYDVDGTIAGFILVDQPEHGRVELDKVTGKFIYYSDKGFTGDASFSFTVTDSDGLVSEPVEVTVRVSSLLENLKNTGRLGAATVLLCAALAAVAGVVAFVIITRARHRRELEEEQKKSRLFEFGGSMSDRDYDDYF